MRKRTKPLDSARGLVTVPDMEVTMSEDETWTAYGSQVREGMWVWHGGSFERVDAVAVDWSDSTDERVYTFLFEDDSEIRLLASSTLLALR